MKIRGAIFDMDGTLVNSLMFWDYLWARIGVEYMNNKDFRPAEEMDKQFRTMIFRDAMSVFMRHYDLPGGEADFMKFASDGIADFYRTRATLKDGASALLEHLSARGVKICLASATEKQYVRVALGHFGIETYFDSVLSCADIGAGKDRPDIYRLAASELGLHKDEICVFEDSYVALETAKREGFHTVGIFDRYNAEQKRLEAASEIYLGEGYSLDELISRLEV